MLKYKENVIDLLKIAGYSSYKLERSKFFSSTELQKMRHDIVVGIKSIDKLCSMLQCQPGDIIEWIPDDDDNNDTPAP